MKHEKWYVRKTKSKNDDDDDRREGLRERERMGEMQRKRDLWINMRSSRRCKVGA